MSDEIQPTPPITQNVVEKLKQAGYAHWADLHGKTTDDMLKVKGIGKKKANQLMDAAWRRSQ